MKGWKGCPVCKGTGKYDADIERPTSLYVCSWMPMNLVEIVSPSWPQTEQAPAIEVVKVQLPVAVMDRARHQALIYDKEQSRTEQRGLNRAEQTIINGRLKVFCNAIYTKGQWRLIDDKTFQNKNW